VEDAIDTYAIAITQTYSYHSNMLQMEWHHNSHSNEQSNAELNMVLYRDGVAAVLGRGGWLCWSYLVILKIPSDNQLTFNRLD